MPIQCLAWPGLRAAALSSVAGLLVLGVCWENSWAGYGWTLQDPWLGDQMNPEIGVIYPVLL